MLTKDFRKFEFKSFDKATMARVESLFDNMFLETQYGSLTKEITFHDGQKNIIELINHKSNDLDKKQLDEKLFDIEGLSFKRPIQITFQLYPYSGRNTVTISINDSSGWPTGANFSISSEDKSFVDRNIKAMEDIFKDCPPVQFSKISVFYHNNPNTFTAIIAVLSSVLFYLFSNEFIKNYFNMKKPGDNIVSALFVASIIETIFMYYLSGKLGILFSKFDFEIGPEYLRNEKKSRARLIWLFSTIFASIVALIIGYLINAH
ncbi:hypothetical protein [Acidiphilium sp. PM]|uniref:hypothetical protein n=2 Tax=unclassified Acidiphilium TaxID=2617493 RepID=UPI0002145AB4|nr:hypothetical protein [Acidiphilium sp. PM]EGO95203.1 Hypothetical protein APM_1966 [Acidiphilium sp. PM]